MIIPFLKDKKNYCRMNKLTILIILIISSGLSAQQNIKLEFGYPKPTKEFFDVYGQFKPSEVKTAQIKTGIDSLQTYFGTAENSKTKFYWVGITNNDSLLGVGAGFILKELKPNIFSSDITLSLDKNNSSKIKFHVDYNSATNSINYHWLNNDDKKVAKLEILNTNKFKIGNKTDELSFLNLAGKKITLDQYKGKIIVLNWWHTRCGPCIKEMPGLNSLVKRHSKNKNIVFLAVAHNTASELGTFLKKREFNYLQFINNEKSVEFFEASYPKHFIIDTKGAIQYYTSGGSDKIHEEIEKELKKLL